MWAKLGIVALLISILLLGYDVLVAVMRMGHTDRFLFVPTSLIKLLGTDQFLWINDIPIAWAQQVALTTVNMPLSFLVFCFSIFCFFIHMIAANPSR